MFTQIIEKRKLDHKRTNGQNLQIVANDNVTRNEDVEIFKSIRNSRLNFNTLSSNIIKSKLKSFNQIL